MKYLGELWASVCPKENGLPFPSIKTSKFDHITLVQLQTQNVCALLYWKLTSCKRSRTYYIKYAFIFLHRVSKRFLKNDICNTICNKICFRTTLEPYNTDEMAKDFLLQFSGQAFTVGQQLVFHFKDKKMLGLVVKSLEAADFSAISSGQNAVPKKTKMGRCLGDTVVQFEKADNSSLNLIGKAKGKVVRQSIINPDWDFQKMGIGGLDKEFSAIFRRAFASRVFPPEIVLQLGCKHVKGILLYGPPGTGKTLMARQIGTMLNAREPKIVNGPQILDKYVGESEANIRRLFADAEDEEKRVQNQISLSQTFRCDILIVE